MALEYAAREHPQLNPNKKPAHRPRKNSPNDGKRHTILGKPAPSLDERRLVLVEKVISQSKGRMSQQGAIQHLKKAEETSQTPGNQKLFASTIETLMVAISKQKRFRKK